MSAVDDTIPKPSAMDWKASAVVKPLSLSANFSWMLLGMVSYAACQWGCLVVLAKLGSQRLVGQFALGLAVSGPVFMLANLKLRSVQATDAKREFDYRDYFGLRLRTTAAALTALAVIVWAAGYEAGLATLILLVGVGRSFDGINDVRYGRLQQSERMDRIAWVMMLNGLLSLGLLWAGVRLTGELIYGVAGWAMGSGVTACVSQLLTRSVRSSAPPSSARSSRPGAWRDLARAALPLGVVMMLVSLGTNVPRYFVEHHLGEAALGVFAAAAYVVESGRMVVLALGQSASPRLARSFAAGDYQAFRGLLLRLVAFGAGAGALGMALSWTVGDQVLTLLYTAEYAEHWGLLVGMSAVAILAFSCSFLADAMVAARSFRIQVPLLAVMVSVTAVGCCWLVPRFGLSGAVASLGAGYACHFAGSICILAALLRVRDSEPS